MPDKIKKLWDMFHNSIIIALLFSMLGVGIGVYASKTFYSNKLDEVIQTGALLFNKKVYTITPKL